MEGCKGRLLTFCKKNYNFVQFYFWKFPIISGCLLFNDGHVLQLWSETIAVLRRMIYCLYDIWWPYDNRKGDWDFRISDLVKNPDGSDILPLWWISVKSGGPSWPSPLSSHPSWCSWDLFRSFWVCSDAKERVGFGKQREATAPIKSLVELQPWFLSLRWKTCLRQNCRPGSCTCSEGPALGQNTLMMMMITGDEYGPNFLTLSYNWG